MTHAALALPFEADDILARLMRWAACESPTFDAGAVNRMMDLALRALIAFPGAWGLAIACARAFRTRQVMARRAFWSWRIWIRCIPSARWKNCR
jgi:hypothetical protein